MKSLAVSCFIALLLGVLPALGVSAGGGASCGRCEGVGASYEVTIVKPGQERAAVMRIDPYTGEASIQQEASTSNQ